MKPFEMHPPRRNFFRSSIISNISSKDIKDISEKYIVEGETADGAILFLPSEAVYAELHANFSDLVREGFLQEFG